jgi:molecular chaperone GrpE (heat shock protein)
MMPKNKLSWRGVLAIGLLLVTACLLSPAWAQPEQAGAAARSVAGDTLASTWWASSGWLGWLLFAVTVLGVIGWVVYHRRAGEHVAVDVKDTEPPAADATVPAVEPAIADGPGPMLVRLQECWQELQQTTQELQRFSGQREVQLQAWQRMASDILRRTIPVLENLEPYLEDDDVRVAEVAQVAYGRLVTELATVGVSQIIPHAGDAFDWRYHQLAPESTGLPPYEITRVLSTGYRFMPRIPAETEQVLKPAEVIAVGLGEELPEPTEEPEVPAAEAMVETVEDAVEAG